VDAGVSGRVSPQLASQNGQGPAQTAQAASGKTDTSHDDVGIASRCRYIWCKAHFGKGGVFRGLAGRLTKAGYCLGQEFPDEHFPRFHPVPTQPVFSSPRPEVVPSPVEPSDEGWKASGGREARPTQGGTTWIFRPAPLAKEEPRPALSAEARSEPTGTIR
jgi:hypothetical protein